MYLTPAAETTTGFEKKKGRVSGNLSASTLPPSSPSDSVATTGPGDGVEASMTTQHQMLHTIQVLRADYKDASERASVLSAENIWREILTGTTTSRVFFEILERKTREQLQKARAGGSRPCSWAGGPGRASAAVNTHWQEVRGYRRELEAAPADRRVTTYNCRS